MERLRGCDTLNGSRTWCTQHSERAPMVTYGEKEEVCRDDSGMGFLKLRGSDLLHTLL